MELRKGRRCEAELYVHLVFLTKFRGEVLKKSMGPVLDNIFGRVCGDFEADLCEFKCRDDYVVLLIKYPAKTTISKLVGSLKGVSSRMLRVELSSAEDVYYDGALWSPSYFAYSDNRAGKDRLAEEMIGLYLRGQ